MGSKPVIEIECKAVGLALKDERGQLRSYFNAAPTVKMGLITDGLIYEFYADSDEPNMMDQKAFLSFDLRDIARGKLEDSNEDGLRSLQKSSFDPDNIGAEAKRKLIFQNLVQQIAKMAEEPSEQLVRMLLQNAGLSHLRSKALTDYVDLTRNAFREFVSMRIIQRLDLPAKVLDVEKAPVGQESNAPDPGAKVDDGIITTETELEVFNYIRRRLSYLVNQEQLFMEIEKISYRDYKGKFVVYYKKERSGRLFDFIEGGVKKYNLDFGSDFGGCISTENLHETDSALLSVFSKRVAELSSVSKKNSSA